MKNYLRWVLIATALSALVGCGLKGPLYYPKPETPKTATTITSSDSTQKKQTTTSGQQNASPAGKATDQSTGK